MRNVCKLAGGALLAIALLVAPSSASAEPVDSLLADDDRIIALGSESSAERVRASRKLVGVGVPAVVPLLEVMDKDERPAGKMAYETLFDMAQQTAGTDRGRALSVTLSRQLLAPNPDEKGRLLHTRQTRRQICRLLSFVGEDEATRHLYRAMNHKDMVDMARWALTRIPSRRATEALIGATQITGRRELLGVIAALGHRREARAVAMLSALADAPDEDIARAARHALAMIPDAQSYEVISVALEDDKPHAVDAALSLCESMIDGGMTANARHLLLEIAKRETLSDVLRCRLLHGLGRAGGGKAIAIVLEHLDNESAKIRGAAVQACTLLPDKEATAAIGAKMEKADPPLKADLLEVLGGRGATLDQTTKTRIIAAAEDPNVDVRVAAIEAIETAGITDATPALLEALMSGDPSVYPAAEHALIHLPGKAFTRKIADALADAPQPTHRALVQALAYRGDPAVLDTLKQATTHMDHTVRAEALRGMGRLGDLRAFDTLLKFLESEAGVDAGAAENGLRLLEGKAATRKMLEAYANASPAQKPPLLRVLGRRKHPAVPALLSKEVASDNEAIRAAAVLGLGRQDDPEVAPTLLEVARRGPASVTLPALFGYFRAAERMAATDKAAAGEMYMNALPLAVTAEQKQEAIEGITRNVDPKRVDTLALVAPLMDDPPLRSHAARAVVHFAVNLPESRRDEAIELLRRAITLDPGDDAVRRAVDQLRGWGVEVDPAHDAGFITSWWVIGPFPNPRGEMWDKAWFPERGVDLNAQAQVGETTITWQYHHTDDLQGLVDLSQIISRRNNIGAYGYAEITVNETRDVIFGVGSDDGIVVWLNGEKIHAINAARGVKVDEDIVQARLQAGTNRVLVKCLNGAAAWGYCVRIFMPDGRPLAFEQKTPEKKGF